MLAKLGFLPLLLAGTLAGAQSTTDPWQGTWNLNVAASKLHDPPDYKTLTINVQPRGGDTLKVKWTMTGTRGDGTPIDLAYDGEADGTPHPIMGNGRQVGTASYSQVSAHKHSAHFDYITGRTISETVTLGQDGKRFTAQMHVTTKQGTYDQTTVFDKS
jgi:hypothetical protein